MKKDEQLEIMEKQFEYDMAKLTYERDTELMKIEHEWKLKNYQVTQQVQYPQVNDPFLQQAPTYMQPPRRPQTPEELSEQKYGGKKDG